MFHKPSSVRQVGDEDFFWEANGRSQFPKMAEDVDAQLQKYKAAVEELNRKTGANVDPNMDPNELMQVEPSPNSTRCHASNACMLVSVGCPYQD